MTVRVRLAPSPTGNLHIGTARTALFNWLFARKNNGKFLIRIEDTDKERSKSSYTENILKGLDWLGIDWDEDPIFQSSRHENHRNAIQFLLKKGLAYRCYATEEELNSMRESQRLNNEAPKYDNRHRNLDPKKEDEFKAQGRTSVVRFKIDENATITWMDQIRGQMVWKGADLGGDMVIARRSHSDSIGDPLYNLVVVVDDADMEITHVIRGEDHLANTAKQILLYEALGFNIPKFVHAPLILNSEGRKLSKRDGVTSISDFQSMGYTSHSMTNYMSLLGWSIPDGMNEKFSIEEAAKIFEFNRVSKSGAKFDWDKLNWLNAQYIHSLDSKKLFSFLKPLWEKEGWQIPSDLWGIKLAELIGPSLILLNDGIEQASPFFKRPTLKEDGIKQLKDPASKEILKIILNKLDKNPWDGKDITFANEILAHSANEANVKKGLVMKSLRASLFGQLNGPDLLLSWSLLAQISEDRTRLRLSS